MPARNASATYQIRCGPGSPICSMISSGLVRRSSSPSAPISRPRSAFWNDSWKLLPIAITSPTDFICVVSVSSAWENFSNAKRGTLVTT